MCVYPLSLDTQLHTRPIPKGTFLALLWGITFMPGPLLSLSLPTAVLCNELSSAEETEESRALKQKKN